MLADVTIRLAKPADVSGLADLWLAASLQAHGFLGAELLNRQRGLMAEIYLPQSETYAALIDEQAVGFASMVDDFMAACFIAPAHQGRGIGKALVYAENEGARRFYARVGFREISRRDVDDNGLPHANIHLRLARGDLV